MMSKRLIFLLVLILSISRAWVASADSVPRPRLRATLNQAVAVPGQILSLEVTILVPTWMPTPPVFPSFEIANANVRLPEGASRPTMERVGGENWPGLTREYQVSPMVIGQYRIPPQTIVVTYADPLTRVPLVVKLRTEAFEFEGRAPNGAEGLDPFIAAESVSIEEWIEGDPEQLEPGFAFTRTVTARLTGASPIMLPPLIAAIEAEGLAAYPKEPIFSESRHRGRITGERIESVTYVAEAGGRFSASPIRIRWWNLRTNQVEVAELSALSIISRGLPPLAPSPTVEWRDLALPILLLCLLVLAVAVIGRRYWPRYLAWRSFRAEERFSSEGFAFKRVAQAVRAQQFGDAIRALELWSSRLPAAAGDNHARLFNPLEPLSAKLYGREGQSPSKRDWSVAMRALQKERSERLVNARAARLEKALPTLNPTSNLRRKI